MTARTASDGAAIGRRALRNACLGYLAAAGRRAAALARAQFDAQANMTDVLAALDVLAATDTADREAALAAFHARWRGDDLVLDKWFSDPGDVAAAADAWPTVRALYRHPDFDLRNPNRVRSLVGAFSAGNQVRFHDPSGDGLPLPRRRGDRARPKQRPDRGAADQSARRVAAAEHARGRR